MFHSQFTNGNVKTDHNETAILSGDMFCKSYVNVAYKTDSW